MKASKDALRQARQLFAASFDNGRLDLGRVKKIIKTIGEKKPRGYMGILSSFHRLVRLEVEKRHATIESAVALSESEKSSLLADLKQKYGGDVTAEFNVNESLIGGMRVKVGNDVWDGSVKARLAALNDSLS